MSEHYATVARNFSHSGLKRICEMRESEFGDAYDMERVRVEQKRPAHFYNFKDHGSNILAVAHLDTVMPHKGRKARFVQSEDGTVVFSGALDDRLGAYIILELLPSLGIQYDILLTVGEESGMSTADFFEPRKDYDWIIEFDRGGTDVVMYQYDDDETAQRVRDCGATVGEGIFSDICYLEHLGVKGFNWGVGYRDYHGPRSHAYLNDTIRMVARYLRFHEQNAGRYMPHTRKRSYGKFGWLWGNDTYASYGVNDSDKCPQCGNRDISSQVCLVCDFCLDCLFPLRECMCHYPNGIQSSGYHGHGFDSQSDDDVIDNPTMSEVQAALKAMDERERKS